MNAYVVNKRDFVNGGHLQINLALNTVSCVNLLHRRVEHRIYDYGKADHRLPPALSGCFLEKCPYPFARRTCNNCECSYFIDSL